MAQTEPTRHTSAYYLGCPIWTEPSWIGPILPSKTNSKTILKAYSKLFNTVEGGSTFYALPPMATIERWMAEAGPNFRFAMKFPKAISHERRLMAAHNETAAFLKILEAMADGGRLGPAFLQLPPSFNINSIDILEAYIKNLPSDFNYAVEIRHISFFDNADNQQRLDDLLSNEKVNKVIFDSRPLFSSEPQDPKEAEAQKRKPHFPVHYDSTADTPFVRFIARNEIEVNAPWIKESAQAVNKWILEGKKPYIFIHAADEANAPRVAKAFNDQLRRINPLIPKTPPFASETSPSSPPADGEQLDLF